MVKIIGISLYVFVAMGIWLSMIGAIIALEKLNEHMIITQEDIEKIRDIKGRA